MKLSTKGRYAVTALADIALQNAAERNDQRLISLSEIAERQDISLAYLEQLFSRLRRAGLVESVRGPGGGYRLARAADRVTIADVMSAVDERLNAMGDCDDEGGGCGGSRARCLTHNLWEQLSSHVHVFLSRTTLADVVADKMAPCPAVPDFSLLIDEDAMGGRTGSA
ncbi:Rrf2 family transcriptional regulator [Albimonas pacifica]|uniref:Transcriptional regulator, BadM/Rrf2 family n=1 Tax=Albimonas pacifica TaxID=1114924 RepID=A0A1I3D783_9RHOB|nr:Rrf2 family transcriptional regulator [Albimonas pacifica]SFH82459.1 transcriptional regulator, BadM/Rrf2 family [Albimonas pacifica]